MGEKLCRHSHRRLTEHGVVGLVETPAPEVFGAPQGTMSRGPGLPTGRPITIAAVPVELLEIKPQLISAAAMVRYRVSEMGQVISLGGLPGAVIRPLGRGPVSVSGDAELGANEKKRRRHAFFILRQSETNGRQSPAMAPAKSPDRAGPISHIAPASRNLCDNPSHAPAPLPACAKPRHEGSSL